MAAAMAAAAPPAGGAPLPAAALAAIIQQAIAMAMGVPPPAGGVPPGPPPGVPPPGAPPAVPPIPPPDTYHTLVDEAGIEDHQTAKVMVETFRDTTWPVAITPFVYAAAEADPPDTALFMRNFMDANALAPKCFLVVADNLVQVAYGMSPCPHLANPGARAFWLMGDYTKVAGDVVVHPKLYRTTGAVNLQSNNFIRSVVPAPSLAEVIAAYDADPAITVVPALQPAADGTAAPTINIWRALPVHQKFACLFLKGVPIRNAAKLVERLLGIIPPEHHASVEQLVHWIRAAASSDGAVPGVSRLNAALTRVDQATAPAVETWFYEVAGRYAPRGVTLGPPLVVPQNPAPPGAGAVDARIVSILENLQRNQSSGALAASEGKTYLPHELTILFMVSGAPTPWSALTEAQLPPVFQQLKPFRAKTGSARLFFERFIVSSYPQDRPHYDFVFSTPLINHLRLLSFNGEDNHCAWDLRAHGFSFFSITPCVEADGGFSTRSKLKVFEDTHENHQPKDRTAHEALSVASSTSLAGKQLPGTRADVRERIEFFSIMCELFFGPDMPLLPGLKAVQEVLYRDTNTRNWHPSKWRALFWNLHCGVRAFFFDGDTARFNSTINRFRQGLGPEDSNVPLEALHSAVITPPGSIVSDDISTITEISGITGTSGASSKRSHESGSAATQEKRQNTQESKAIHPFSVPFQADLDRVRAKSIKCTAKALAPTKPMRQALFGTGFLSLCGQSNPCVSHWILGRCHDQKCPNSHTVAVKPSVEVHKMVAANVKARCDYLIAKN